MNVVVIGTGYVGLVTGACLADSGQDVTCVDINAAKVEALRRGEIPIYEPGLEEIVLRNVAAGRLKFSTDPAGPVPAARCLFLAVGTPQSETGAADLTYLFKAVDSIAPHLSPDAIVIVKSTVPVGTNRRVAERLRQLTGRTVDVASNPEFLKEGCAIEDFTRPDRVVVGVERPEVAALLEELYRPFLPAGRRAFLVMGLESSEMTKYVANCFLATKISFINEMANLCEAVGANVQDVRQGIGFDSRIGFAFLAPGAGYGGSCFPKDVRAVISMAEEKNVVTQLLQSVDDVNHRQKDVLFLKLERRFQGALEGKRIALWGLAFKPRTDDVREAPALVLIDHLLASGCEVHVHDPVAMDNVRRIYGDRITYHTDLYEALEQADALAVVTEWGDYRTPDFAQIKARMRNPLIIDGRNLYFTMDLMKQGILCEGIGIPRP